MHGVGEVVLAPKDSGVATVRAAEIDVHFSVAARPFPPWGARKKGTVKKGTFKFLILLFILVYAISATFHFSIWVPFL